jgi:hypothetical protein
MPSLHSSFDSSFPSSFFFVKYVLYVFLQDMLVLFFFLVPWLGVFVVHLHAGRLASTWCHAGVDNVCPVLVTVLRHSGHKMTIRTVVQTRVPQGPIVIKALSSG